MKSFRARIVLWTTVAAGLVMLAFGVAGNIAFERVKLKQVDDSLRVVVERPAAPPTHGRYWDRVGDEIRLELERRFGTEAVVAVYGYRRPTDESEGLRRFEILSWGVLEGLYDGEGTLPPASGTIDPSQFSSRFGMQGPEGPGPRGRGRNDRFSDPPTIEAMSVKHIETGEVWRVACAKHQGFNVLFAINYVRVREDAALMRTSFAIVFPVALLVLGASIWFFVTKSIRPLGELASAIENVSARNLDARLSESDTYSEFAPLIHHFNGMLERLQRSFTQATRFSADAAHELKTPLAILQGQLEVAFQKAEDGSEQQALLAGLLEETHRLKAITRKLLILAKADAGTLEVQRERIDLGALLVELIELASEDDPTARIEFSGGELEGVGVAGDDTLVRQILNNLIGNALKYRDPRESEILVELRRSEDDLLVEVENRCQPLSAEARSRLFDRFVRVDPSRNRADDGTGLGLSLSLEFAKAQGGSLELIEVGEADRLRMRLRLPAYSESAS